MSKVLEDVESGKLKPVPGGPRRFKQQFREIKDLKFSIFSSIDDLSFEASQEFL